MESCECIFCPLTRRRGRGSAHGDNCVRLRSVTVVAINARPQNRDGRVRSNGYNGSGREGRLIRPVQGRGRVMATCPRAYGMR